MTRPLILAFLAWSWPTVAAADPALGLRLHARIGSIEAPFYTDALPVVRSELQAYALVVEPWYELTTTSTLGARLPIATSSVEQPAGSYVADYTIGNPELYLTRDLPPLPLAARPAVPHLRLALALPLAGHGPAMSLVRNRVVAASDAVEGWHDPELYQPGVLALTASAGLHLERPRWRASARAKLPLLLRVSDASLPPDARPRALGFMPSLQLSAAWRIRPSLALGLAGDLVVAAPSPLAPTRSLGRSGSIQPSLTPHLSLHRRPLSVSLDLLLALGGPLRGSLGLGLHLGWRR